MSGDETVSPTSTSGGIFPKTRWSVVYDALDSQAPEGPAALEELCRIYWKPVYLFIRSRNHSPEESEDLAQEFFYRLLSKNHLRAVEGPEKGRMRSFLCVVLKRFLADEYDKRMTQKRGGNWRAIPIDAPSAEAQFSQSHSSEVSPDILFDRHWALELLNRTLALLKSNYEQSRQAVLFEKLKPVISPHLEQLPYARLAEELDMTEGAVKVAAHRLRARYRELLHASLRDTLANPDDVEEELRYLLSLFSRG
jgi:RNA polymerase sigma-70 factor (ECF subfamily)